MCGLPQASPQRAHRVNVRADDFGNAAGQEVPDDDTAVVAAHRQERAPAVEGAGERHADTVKGAIGLL